MSMTPPPPPAAHLRQQGRRRGGGCGGAAGQRGCGCWQCGRWELGVTIRDVELGHVGTVLAFYRQRSTYLDVKVYCVKPYYFGATACGVE
jgi:hypothetical protein